MMDNQSIEMITKMVLESLKATASKENGYMVPVGVSARHVQSHSGTCGYPFWRGI